MNIPIYTMKINERKEPNLLWEKEIQLANDTFIDAPEIAVMLAEQAFGIKNLAEEHVILLGCFNTQFTSAFEISHGTHNYAFFSQKAVFTRLLLAGVAEFIVIHNHPGGRLSPSTEDFQCCRQLKEGAKLLGLTMQDFVIVSSRGYLSFAKEKLL